MGNSKILKNVFRLVSVFKLEDLRDKKVGKYFNYKKSGPHI